ncbi:glycoside hydrolase family 16 protein [Umezawaea sp.]|uniref:glycoside hydrolase family 16 protein n=1 Tax=Umezawaea sp. TaxID=1955258 RepID=UPI002ED04131
MTVARPRTVIALAVVLLTAACSSPDLGAEQQPDWQVTWREDFDGAEGAPPAADGWILDTGTAYPGGPANWGTGEVQTYTADRSNIGLDGRGNLEITPRRDASGAWTSGRVQSRRADFTAPEGGALRIEGRVRMPDVRGDAGLGYWAAFWALGAPYRDHHWNWPGVGEVDVVENVNGVDRVWGVLHCGVAAGGPCDEPRGIGADSACPGSPCLAEFHTYAFEWDRGTSPNEFRWYVDGQRYHSVDEARVGPAAWASMTSHTGFFVLLNVAVGGAFPDGVAGRGTPTATTAPDRSMVVDHVSVSTRAGR